MLPRLFGLDYNPADGLLYGITGDITVDPAVLDLLVIDPSDGALLATRTLDTLLGNDVPGSLLFDYAGTLHGTTIGSTNNLFEIDPATGAVSNIRTAEEPAQGLGLIIPEPTTAQLIFIALAIAHCRRHKDARMKYCTTHYGSRLDRAAEDRSCLR